MSVSWWLRQMFYSFCISFIKIRLFPASFSLFSSFQPSWRTLYLIAGVWAGIIGTSLKVNKSLMTGFELWISGCGGARSTNWATTTTHFGLCSLLKISTLLNLVFPITFFILFSILIFTLTRSSQNGILISSVVKSGNWRLFVGNVFQDGFDRNHSSTSSLWKQETKKRTFANCLKWAARWCCCCCTRVGRSDLKSLVRLWRAFKRWQLPDLRTSYKFKFTTHRKKLFSFSGRFWWNKLSPSNSVSMWNENSF